MAFGRTHLASVDRETQQRAAADMSLVKLSKTISALWEASGACLPQTAPPGFLGSSTFASLQISSRDS